MGISYHLVGLSAKRNYFTSQFRSRGRWIKYDCLDGGITSSSPEFNQHLTATFALWNSNDSSIPIGGGLVRCGASLLKVVYVAVDLVAPVKS